MYSFILTFACTQAAALPPQRPPDRARQGGDQGPVCGPVPGPQGAGGASGWGPHHCRAPHAHQGARSLSCCVCPLQHIPAAQATPPQRTSCAPAARAAPRWGHACCCAACVEQATPPQRTRAHQPCAQPPGGRMLAAAVRSCGTDTGGRGGTFAALEEVEGMAGGHAPCAGDTLCRTSAVSPTCSPLMLLYLTIPSSLRVLGDMHDSNGCP